MTDFRRMGVYICKHLPFQNLDDVNSFEGIPRAYVNIFAGRMFPYVNVCAWPCKHSRRLTAPADSDEAALEVASYGRFGSWDVDGIRTHPYGSLPRPLEFQHYEIGEPGALMGRTVCPSARCYRDGLVLDAAQ